MSRCNADVDHRCDVNDGEPCAECVAFESDSAEAWIAYGGASPLERDPDQYERDMQEAGRGRLLP